MDPQRLIIVNDRTATAIGTAKSTRGTRSMMTDPSGVIATLLWIVNPMILAFLKGQVR